MNRKEIKKLAKEKVAGNKWNIWWPLIVIITLYGAIEGMFGPTLTINIHNIEEFKEVMKTVSSASYISTTGLSIILAILSAGYLKYLLNFVRTGKFDAELVVKTIKSKWVNILVSYILVTFIITLSTMLFIVPGIIASLGLTMATLLVIDKDVKGHESLKASRDLMHGYKWNYFVFQLSFIGWYLLVPLTLGFLLIWLIPYVSIANTIYYDKLSSQN